MLKIFGSVLIMMSTTAAGAAALHKLWGHVRFLEKMCWILKNITTEIRFNSSPIIEILKKLSKSNEAPEFITYCCKLCENGMPFPDAWRESVNEKAISSGADKADIVQLLEFGSCLGTTDTEGQVSCCTLYENRLNESLKSAKENREKKSKLCMTLGVSAGLTVILLIL